VIHRVDMTIRNALNEIQAAIMPIFAAKVV
jgi:hypothetical protein